MSQQKVFVLFGLLSLAGLAFGAEPARFALVIGNASYEGDAALAHSINDATDVSATLNTLGWKVTNLFNADRRTTNNTLAAFRDSMAQSPNATALLYYAGHGVQIAGQNYLIPVRGVFETPDDVINEAISLQSVQSAFDDAQASVSIMILDACRDNPFARKNNRSLGSTRGLSVINKSASVEGSAVLFATAPGDTASDGEGRNGTFTQALLKYLPSELPLQLMVTRLTSDVKQATNGRQTPYSSLSLSSEFYFGARSAAPDAVSAMSLKPSLPTLVAAPLGRSSLGRPLGLLTWTGVAVTAGGLGFAAYAYAQAIQASATYQANAKAELPDQSVFAGTRATIEQMNLWYANGIWTATGAVVVAAATWALDEWVLR